jgi:hypothetical protein
MKEIILFLIKRYHELGITTKDTIMIGQGEKMVVRMSVQRTSKAWGICNIRGEYDDKETIKLVNEEKERIASELYQMTEDTLKSISKWKEVIKADPRRTITSPQQKMSWCIRALMKPGIEIISAYDVMYLSELQKEEVNYGLKREATTTKTREEKAKEELAEVKEDFEVQ